MVLELPSFAAELQSSIAKLGKLRFCLEFAELGIRSFGVEFPSLANSVSMLSCRCRRNLVLSGERGRGGCKTLVEMFGVQTNSGSEFAVNLTSCDRTSALLVVV